MTQIEFIRDTPSIKKTRPLEPYVDTEYFYKDHTISRKRKFRKYRQTVGMKKVYYKEFGDPRVMDSRTGEYVGKAKPSSGSIRPTKSWNLPSAHPPMARSAGWGRSSR